MPTANPFVGSQAQRQAQRERRRAGPVRSTPPPPPIITPTAAGSLCIRGVYGFLGISDGAADGVYWAQPAFTYETDSQYIAAVLGDEGGNSGVKTVLYFHCDSTFTSGAYLAISFLGVTLGSFTRSSSNGVITYYPFNGASLSMLLVAGQIVGVQNVGTAYNILVNGQSVLTFTGGSVPTGPTYRSAFVSMSRFTDSHPFVWDSYRVAALSLADYVQPVYTGTGARVSRRSTSGLTDTGSDYLVNQLIPGATFDAINKSTADIGIDLSTGKISVSQPGWYRVTARLQLASQPVPNTGGYTTLISLLLYKNGAINQYGQQASCSKSQSGTIIPACPLSIFGTFDVDLDANDYVQIGTATELRELLNPLVIVGEATGAQTYIGITLLNKKVG